MSYQFFCIFFITVSVILSIPSSNIRNLQALHDENSGGIIVKWNYMRPSAGVYFTVRYRLDRENPKWIYARTAHNELRINHFDFKHGNELFVQVRAEKDGQIIDDWGQELIVTIKKKVSVGGMLIDDNELIPPLNFTTHILGPSSVKLEWRPHEGVPPELFYIVNIKQLTSESGTSLQQQQIKTTANGFTLGKLIAGERYEMTIRSALNASMVSSTAAIVEISMPKENEYFEIGNLIISSHFHSNHRGIVNLTWEVPLHMVHQIASFDVQYVEAGNDNWQRVVFHGTRPSALLHNLKSDTEYILKIKTTLTNNVQTESGDFRFKTPKVEANPIQKVDVVFSQDVSSVRLQWILEPHVKTDLIAGYDVYVSDDKDRPDSQWKLTQLNGREASLALDGLRGSTEYFVRVNVRNKDGSIIRAPSIYRFKTIDKKGSNTERREGNSLSYRNIGPGQVEISWTYPSSVLDNVAGATIFYIDAEEASSEHWQKIFIDNPTETTVLLSQLKQGTRYSVQIIPRLRNGNFDYLSASTFELKTDTFATTASDAIISTEINNPESIIGDVRHNEKTPKIRKKHVITV